MSPIGGMTMSFTIEVTIAPNAAPMITATARSSTLPLITNALKSLNIWVLPFRKDYFCFAIILSLIFE